MTVLSYRQALHDTLRAELRRDEDVFLIGEEIGVFEGSYKITAGLLAEFGPRRVRDTPICEEGFTGVAIGAAMMGPRPVAEIMTINFSLLAIDQIVSNAAKLRSLSGGQVSVPLVIRTPGGGRQLSATHSQNLEAWYAHVPGLKVVAPATCADAKGLLAATIRDDDPVLVLENLALYNTRGEVLDGEHVAEIRCAAVLKPGRDVTIVGYSRAAVIALDVARRLEDDGISAEVVDLRSLRPLDRDTVCASVRKTGRAVIVEDGWLSYGTGAEIAATIAEAAFDYLDAPVRRVAAEGPLPYAKPLEFAALPDAGALVLAQDGHQVALVLDQAPVQQFTAAVAYPEFHDRVHSRLLNSGVDDPNASSLKTTSNAAVKLASRSCRSNFEACRGQTAFGASREHAGRAPRLCRGPNARRCTWPSSAAMTLS